VIVKLCLQHDSVVRVNERQLILVAVRYHVLSATDETDSTNTLRSRWFDCPGAGVRGDECPFTGDDDRFTARRYTTLYDVAYATTTV